SDPDNDRLVIQWKQMSGPAPATLSAPWGEATTVTMTTVGTYTFQLSATDAIFTVNKTMTVTVLSAASQTAFYVDPSYTGGGSDGSASDPWTTLSLLRPSSAEWVAINTALASNHVIVYFSARQASSDTPEVEHQETDLWRSDTSTHHLTFDGMSKYNTNDS